MQVQVHYQGLETTQWADQFILNRISKLNRYLDTSSSAHVDVRVSNRKYSTTLSLHYKGHDYAFSSVGENLYEVFSSAVDKANRALVEHKSMMKDKIHRRSSTLHEVLAS